ncbi:MAG: VacB/RNase II family 3'-5' exoribonuclease [Elusimicrobia bacterium]|nr:VacB/RNase II family 3'-5' exoribonuclease [Elusimicrobiota bacterium]
MRNRSARRTRRNQPSRPPQPRPGRPQRPAPRPSGPGVEGRLEHHGTFGFVVCEPVGDGDVYVKGPSLRLGADGDRVRVRVYPGGARREGEILEVIQRARSTLVGPLRQAGGRWLLTPREGEPLVVERFAKGCRPVDGAVAVARVTQWPALNAEGRGVVEEVLGAPEAPRVRVTAALRERELPEAFPAEASAEAERFGKAVPPDALKGRKTLFHIPVFTIDGADAKDFDDAVSLERLPSGRWRLGVHIADVSWYVRPGTELDREAYRRATSVYLPDRVVPMLPPALSDNLCSLMPGLERLTLSTFIELSEDGHVFKTEEAETVIRSARRFTYEEVSEVLRGGHAEGVTGPLRDSVLAMGRFQKALTEARIRRGALDFDMPEFRVLTDARGVPTDLVRRDRLDSHRLIEEFMILANEAVARRLIAANRPALHRIHPPPDPAKLAMLSRELAKLGVRAAPRDARGLQAVLRLAHEHPAGDTLTVLCVRSLKQAQYTAQPGPHYGLASQAYCHFTSPIRRYPDLVVHRALRHVLGRPAGAPPALGWLGQAGPHCSERERLAAEAERSAVNALRAEVFARRVGQVLDAVVTRVESYGAFVELTGTGGSGLVRGLRAALGARVRVKIEGADPNEGRVALRLVR